MQCPALFSFAGVQRACSAQLCSLLQEFRVPPVSSFAWRNVRSQADVLQTSGRYERVSVFLYFCLCLPEPATYEDMLLGL